MTIQPTFKLHSKQLLAWKPLTESNEIREVLFGGAKNGGKSFVGAAWVFSSALTYPNTFYFIARKELGQLRSFTIPTIFEWFKVSGLSFDQYASYNGQDNVFNLKNGSRVSLIACTALPSDPLYERFGSMQFTQGWIEEGGEIPEAAYENLKLSIGRWQNDTYGLKFKLLITCNPKKNWMYRKFYKPFTHGTLEKSRCFIQSLVTDNAFRQSGSLEVLDQIEDRVTKARLRYGEWEYAEDDNSLMSFDAVSAIFTNIHVKPEGNKYMTVDVARFGADKTIIRVWHGLVVVSRESLEKQSTTQIAKRITELVAKYSVPMVNVVIDEDGVGGGVLDQLTGAKGFQGNASPVNLREGEQYENLKAQCAYRLAENINKFHIFEKADIDTREKLSADLMTIKEKDMEKEGKRGIESKDKAKQSLGRSPDDGDTYIMRMFFEVKNFSIIRSIQKQAFSSGRTDYSL